MLHSADNRCLGLRYNRGQEVISPTKHMATITPIVSLNNIGCVEHAKPLLIALVSKTHDDIKTTLWTYGHLYPNRHDDTVAMLNTMIEESQARLNNVAIEQKKPRSWLKFIGSGGWIRTNGLRVMSPTSCHCSTPRQPMKYMLIPQICQPSEQKQKPQLSA